LGLVEFRPNGGDRAFGQEQYDPNLSIPETFVVNSGDNSHDVTIPHP
jgi:hypothetical protein